MKLRVLPEDFIVEEVSNIEILKNKEDYTIYELKKNNLETLEIISKLSKKYNLKRNEIGYAGIKDRHAITTQLISIATKYNILDSIKENYSLTKLGFSKSPIKTGNLIGNKFTITIRDLEEKQTKKLNERIEKIKEKGIINYFDSQRFGNVINKVFIAKFLAKRDYENAVKYILLSQYQSYSNKDNQIEYDKLKKNWNNFGSIKANLLYLDLVQKKYLEQKSFKSAYKVIPSKIKEMVVMSYQSYLWNECVKIIVTNNKDYYKVNYNIGELFFSNKKIETSQFIMFGRNCEPNEKEKEITKRVLEKEGLTLENINDISKSGSFLKTSYRDVVIFNKDLKVLMITRDDKYTLRGNNRYLVKLEFTLQKGSYATVLMKEIFQE